MRLRNKVAIITGGGSGMGRSAALLFTREGAKVVICDVNDEGGNQTVRMVREAGGEVSYIHCDVSKSAEVQATIEFTIRSYGKLDILYNNAGYGGPGNCVEMSEEDWDRMLSVNLKGIFLFCKYAIPEMIKQPLSSIVNTASIAAFTGGLPLNAGTSDAYCASKGAVAAMTRSLAVGFGKYGLRANAICPGPIDTPLTEPIHAVPGLVEWIDNKCPLGRIGKPEEVANLALFLASDESSLMTGVVVPVDGGYLANA